MEEEKIKIKIGGRASEEYRKAKEISKGYAELLERNGLVKIGELPSSFSMYKKTFTAEVLTLTGAKRKIKASLILRDYEITMQLGDGREIEFREEETNIRPSYGKEETGFILMQVPYRDWLEDFAREVNRKIEKTVAEISDVTKPHEPEVLADGLKNP